MSNSLRSVINAMVNGILYSLIIWGVLTIWDPGKGSMSYHHMTEYVFITGLVAAYGSLMGWRDHERFGKRS